VKKTRGAIAILVVPHMGNGKSMDARYPERFYRDLNEESLRSAREVVPIVMELVNPTSVVDVGCGTGAWLRAFQEYGVSEVFGVDGDWVDARWLQIPSEKFSQADLRNPLHLNRQFDLALALEVAEHLPMEAADVFVDSLTRLAPVVLFSAAIPFQGGTNHLNEQWPEYWAKLFDDRGYEVSDCIRSQIWQDDRVAWWYRQNLLLFVRKDVAGNYPQLFAHTIERSGQMLSVVHPRNYLRLVEPQATSLVGEVIRFLGALKRILGQRVSGFFRKEKQA